MKLKNFNFLYFLSSFSFFKSKRAFNSGLKRTKGTNNKIAICAVFKDENQYVREWIDYHLKMGFDFFLIYDNESKIPLKETVKDYIDKGIVRVIFRRGQYDGRQCETYSKSISLLVNFKWVAFIDIDEFIVLLNEEKNVKDYLDKFGDDVSGVGLNWLVFGSNGHIKSQDLVINSYTQSCPNHPKCRLIKSIIKPIDFLGCDNPHFFYLRGKMVNVNGQIMEVGSKNIPPILDKNMRINHYFTRSYEEFRLKQKRGGGNSASKRKTFEFYKELQKENVQNYDIINFLDSSKIN